MAEENTNVEETTTAAAETTETTEAAPAAWFAKYDFDSEETADTKIAYYKTLEGKEAELQQKSAEWDEKLHTLSYIDKEPDAELATLESYKAKGIPLRLATQIMESTREELQSNPVEALILHEALKNPAKFKEMGRAGIEEAIKEKYNIIDVDTPPSALMKSDAFDAIMAIEKSKSEVVDVKNPFTFAKEKKEADRNSFVQRQQGFERELDKAISQIKEVKVMSGDKELSLKVTKEELDTIFTRKDGLANLPFDLSTKEGVKEFNGWVEKQVLWTKYLSGEVLTKWGETHAADTEQKVTKEVLNGQAKVVDRSTAAPKSTGGSPLGLDKVVAGMGMTPITPN